MRILQIAAHSNGIITKKILPLACLMSLGCGTWLGNPKDPDEGGGNTNNNINKDIAEVNLEIKSSNPSLNLVASTIPVIGVNSNQIGTLTINEAYLVLKEIELSSSASEDDGEIDFEGPFIVDLVTNQLSPPAPKAEINPGFYDRIKLKLEKVEEDEASSIGTTNQEIIGRSVYIDATYNDGTQTKDLTMTFELSEEFELNNGVNGVNLLGGEAHTLLIQFNLPQWFDFSNSETNEDAVDLDSITESSVTLSEDSEDETSQLIHEVVKENIKSSADFGKDKDGDGEIEDDEREDRDEVEGS